MRAISILLLCGAVCVADDKPQEPTKVKLPLGKDTTRVFGPLDKHGYIDYEAALNAELSKGITPEKNVMALLIQVFGPAPEGGDGMPPAYFKWLGVPMPPKDGDYFIDQTKFLRNLNLTEEQRSELYKIESDLRKRPWVAKDCPPLAEWIKANEKPLTIVAEAVQRPHYFSPIVSRRKEGEPSNVIGALLSTVQKCRELASILSLRATLRIKEGKFNDAWNDILTIHRLGRLTSRGTTLIEGLVGYAICAIASDATITYLAFADLSSKQTLEKLKELQALPPIAKVADKVDLGERFMGLDALQLIRRGDVGAGMFDGDLNAKKPTAMERKGLEALDWPMMMKKMNAFYDRLAAAMRLKDRTDREKEFDKIDDEFKALVKKSDESELTKFFNKFGSKATSSEKIINTLLGLLAPAIRKVQTAEDRIAQFDRNVQVAFALKAYHKDTGKYPAKLADLAPKYLASVPEDIFSGKPLIYKPNAKGYRFHSVGANGKDDGGVTFGDDPPGDDLRVQMPLPEK